MKVSDRFSARWRARQDRKLMSEAKPKRERLRTKLARLILGKQQPEAQPLPLTRVDRRRAMREAGPVARSYRLHTHMRRPLVAVHCSAPSRGGAHKPDKRMLAWLARREMRRLETQEEAAA